MNLKNHMKKKFHLLRRILALLILGFVVWLIFKACRSEDVDHFKIERTPMRVERIRNIVHLATISYQDEVVVDSIEYYKSGSEKFAGTLSKMTDLDDIKHAISDPYVKRKIALIVQGKIEYGFDLQNPVYQLKKMTDSLMQVTLPQPEILVIATSPSGTRVFLENGTWKDYEIQYLKEKSKQQMKRDFEALHMESQAKQNIEHLIRQLIPAPYNVKFIYK